MWPEQPRVITLDYEDDGGTVSCAAGLLKLLQVTQTARCWRIGEQGLATVYQRDGLGLNESARAPGL